MREYHKRGEKPEEGTVSDFDRPVVPVGCLFQGCYNPAFEAEIEKGKSLCHEFNMSSIADKRRYPLHESVKEV